MKVRRWRRIVFLLMALPLLVLSGSLAWLYQVQEQMIFYPSPLPAEHRFSFAAPFEEVSIPVEGAVLNAVHFQQPEPRGLIFFLHGNGGNAQSWGSSAEYYQRVNYDMFLLDYRGYGKSTGQIDSEEQLLADVRAAWDAIAPDYAGKPIVIHGRSLGAALAVQLAAGVDSELVVLVSPFTSVIDMARLTYPGLPATMVRYPLRSDAKIGAINAPIIVVHGDQDEIIPIEQGRALAELAGDNAEFVTIEGARHNDIHGFDKYLDRLKEALP